MAPRQFRCAIYTRKSSEEGLEQGFNSLHAQREACEAYVMSQIGEGWAALPTIYDDGGFSGGTMERPGLVQLLSDIEKGRIDIVVVYKVDRLTRALSDFARIVEIFDKHGVSFVSVTQAFNTTSSMGRLTLNVLLSFAQFEREVTGERIRDKIAASKAKGMWMGGNVPLGYDIPTDPQNRVLAVNQVEAETVRQIFGRYLELGSVRRLADDLRCTGVLTKRRVTAAGVEIGGGPWREGPLYYFLKNRIYRGDIVHKGTVYAGRHQAIVDDATFAAVQAKLAEGAAMRSVSNGMRVRHTLTGKIFDDRGNPMSPVCARRAGRLHRYYASQAVIRGDRGEAGSLPRVPAEAAEALAERVLMAKVDPAKVNGEVLSALIRMVVSKSGVELTLDPLKLCIGVIEAAPADDGIVLQLPVILKTFGGTRRVCDCAGVPLQAIEPDVALQKAIARGRRWEHQLATGERAGADDIAAIEGVQSRYVDKLLKLAWLAPELVEDIVAGRRLRGLTLGDLMGMEIPLDWYGQRQILALA